MGSLRELDAVIGAAPLRAECRAAHTVATLYCRRAGGAEGRVHFVTFAPCDAVRAGTAPSAPAPHPRHAAGLPAVLSVLTALAHARRHVPYRASALTHFLRPSLRARHMGGSWVWEWGGVCGEMYRNSYRIFRFYDKSYLKSHTQDRPIC